MVMLRYSESVQPPKKILSWSYWYTFLQRNQTVKIFQHLHDRQAPHFYVKESSANCDLHTRARTHTHYKQFIHILSHRLIYLSLGGSWV